MDDPVRTRRPRRRRTPTTGSARCSFWQPCRSRSGWPRWSRRGTAMRAAGWCAWRRSRAPRTRLLGSVTGFAVRRSIAPTVGWAIGIAAYFLLLGALIASILEFFDTNPRFADLAAAAGFAGLDSANGFAAALFGLLAIPTGLYAATRLAAHGRRREGPPLDTGVRHRCFANSPGGNEIAVTTAGVALLHVIAGLAIWAGAAITGAPLTIGDALAGALNSAPIAWLAVGAATSGGRLAAVRRRLRSARCRWRAVSCSTLSPKACAHRSGWWACRRSPTSRAVPNAPPDWAATAAFLADRHRPGRCWACRIRPPRPDHIEGADDDRHGREVLICTPRTWPRNSR